MIDPMLDPPELMISAKNIPEIDASCATKLTQIPNPLAENQYVKEVLRESFKTQLNYIPKDVIYPQILTGRVPEILALNDAKTEDFKEISNYFV